MTIFFSNIYVRDLNGLVGRVFIAPMYTPIE